MAGHLSPTRGVRVDSLQRHLTYGASFLFRPPCSPRPAPPPAAPPPAPRAMATPTASNSSDEPGMGEPLVAPGADAAEPPLTPAEAAAAAAQLRRCEAWKDAALSKYVPSPPLPLPPPSPLPLF